MIESGEGRESTSRIKLSRRDFLIAGGLAGSGLVAAAIANRARVAETLFGESSGMLLDPGLDEKFPLVELDFPDGKVEFRDLKPENLRNDDNTPLIMMGGYGMDQTTIGYVLSELLKNGQHVIALDIKGGSGAFGDISGKGELARQGNLIAEFTRNYLDQNPDIERVDLLGASVSTMRILNFLVLHPEMIPTVRNVMPLSPMLGDIDILDLAKGSVGEARRYSKVEKDEEANKIDKEALRTQFRTFVSNPIRRIEELLGMVGEEYYPFIEYLIDSGINIGIIQGVEDLIRDPDSLMELIGDGFPRTVVEITEEGEGALTEDKREPGSKQTYQYIPLSDGDRAKLRRTPPVRLVSGGHEFLGPRKIAYTIMREIDFLNGYGPYKSNS